MWRRFCRTTVVLIIFGIAILCRPIADASKSGGSRSCDGDITGAKTSNGKQTNETMGRLLDRLLCHYDKELVPARPVVVKVDIQLFKVKSTIEKEGIFESVLALFIQWNDPRMTWNPKDYTNISVLAFDSEEVWLPDVAMTNSADHLYSISRDTRFVARVNSDGTFKFIPTGTARTWCDLKLLAFPFDIQTCGIEFESWSLDSSTMTFHNESKVILDDNFTSSQWKLCGCSSHVFKAYYNFTGETFTRVRFDLVVQRKSTFYVINLIFPCATLSFIQLLVFAIPSVESSSDRIGFGTTNLLTLVVFQTIVTAEMPKTSDAVTTLSKYIIFLIILSALGICESVIVERILRQCGHRPTRWLIKLSRTFPFSLCWKKNGEMETADTGTTMALETTEQQRPRSCPPRAEEEDEADLVSKRQRNWVTTASARQSHMEMKRLYPDRSIDRSVETMLTPELPEMRQHRREQRKKNNQNTAVVRQRRRSSVYASVSSDTQVELWQGLAGLIDVLTFIISFLLAVTLPLILFLPHIIETGLKCSAAKSDDCKPPEEMISSR